MIIHLPVQSAVYSLASFKSDEIPCIGCGDADGKITLWNILEHKSHCHDGRWRHDGKIELWME